MLRYRDNAKWLMWLAPMRTHAISAAYLSPFFLSNGLNQAQIFSIQSIFSIAYLLWEVPSGYIADRFGRARCIKLSAPLAAISMIGYGLSSHYWQFIVGEIGLAIASGLVSGGDTALLYDSLKADGREDEFVRLSQRIKAVGFVGTTIGVPIAILLVTTFGIGSTLMADGALLLLGCPIIWKLVEAPHQGESAEKDSIKAWGASCKLLANTQARWIIALGVSLSTATYLAAWLSTPYYLSLGVPLWAFSIFMAVRNLFKALLAHRFHGEQHLLLTYVGYALTAGLVYAAMASGQVWLIWVILGHDAIQALHEPPLTRRLNHHISAEVRATLNSVANLMQRLVFAVCGPLVGLLVDQAGLSTGFVAIGTVTGTFSLVAVARLNQLKTFSNPE